MVVGEPKRSIMEGIENTGDVRLHDHRLRLKQRFDIIRKLGQGTYGKVQLGINKKTGQEVAIKTIKKCKIETEADLVRIRREVQIMSSVRHPNIVHIYEVFENSEKMILVMEYCAGGELYDYLSQQKVLQEDEARRLFRQIATAVYYCHKHKICHRDLKLENVLIDEHGSAKIADFGLSNVFEERRLLSTFCGSPLYASPEIVKGTPYIGPEVDCWSLGVLLYTLVYGAMPFDGSNFKRLVKQISTGDYFEPKSPSSASPLIREMLTVDPIKRADIPHICDHPWVNKGSDVSCLELAEILANETPVRLDLLLSLAPPPTIGSDKLVVTDEVSQIASDGSPARSMSVANIDNSAERRILEMVAEGGTDAIKPSPTRTIINNEQPKRKLETTMSMDNAPSQRKKERIIRSSSGSRQNIIPADSDISITPYVENNCVSNDVSMGSQNDTSKMENNTSELIIPSQNQEPIVVQPKDASPTITKNLSQLTLEISNDKSSVSPKRSPEKIMTTGHTNKEAKPEPKIKETTPKPDKPTAPKPSVIKKKIISPVKKDEKPKPESFKEKSPPRKSIEKDITGRVITTDKKAEKKETSNHEASPTNDSSVVKSPERRKSRILDAAEKMNNLTIQPNPPAPEPTQTTTPVVKPKKVLIPGVSVGSFKEQFERRASLTSGNIPVPSNEPKKPINKTTSGTSNNTVVNKPSGIKKINSVDSEHPQILNMNYNKEPANIKLETIGVEPMKQAKEEPPKPTVEVKKPAIVEVHKVPKILHKSESMREHVKQEPLNNSMSLEDARRSLQQSISLLSQAKSESKPDIGFEDAQRERQNKLKTAREIISNAIGDDGKKVQRICMGGKPPVPYGSGGRSSSGTISLHSLNSLPGSPPTSPPHPRLLIRESPARTFRTEVQHRVDDVRNKYLPNSRGGSVERIIPIRFADEAPKSSSLNNTPTTTQLPYQRNNTMPFRFGSIPRESVSDFDSEKSSQPSTPSTINPSKAEPIKKSPREFIIPIAVEGKGYVTPRQGSVEPSDIPTKMTPSNIGFASRFPKPRRITSLVSGGESEDEDDMHMHRLRSSRRIRADPEKDSVSSGEEDDDEGFELLTAENLFSTLLDRVRSLTNRLNGEEGTGFPQHHQSLFNNLHSPFFNSPHLPRKHKRHNVIREGPSWRRSTSRDVTSDFDSMFPSHPGFPRGSKKSRKAAATSKSSQKSDQSQSNSDAEKANSKHKTRLDDESHESLDLSDLDLSKMELSEKDMETLSGLTPALSRRLQKQLLEHLPPAAARSLRRTLSMNCPTETNSKKIHKYTRSSSASKTTSTHSSFAEEDNFENIVESNTNNNPLMDDDSKKRDESMSLVRRRKYKYHSMDDDDSSSVSTISKTDKDNNNSTFMPQNNASIINHDKRLNSIDISNGNGNSHSPIDFTAKSISSVRSTPDKSVLRKYFSDEISTPDDYLSHHKNINELGSPYSDSNYLYGYSNSLSNNDGEGLFRRRSLKASSESNPRRRISRFLRPDFFDTPREESIYVREKLDKESETQKVLKEIREKRNKTGAISPNSYLNENPYFDTRNSNINFKTCASPTSPLTPNRSRSVTPFYPILDNIQEIHSISNKDTNIKLSTNDLQILKPENGIQKEEKIKSGISNTELLMDQDSQRNMTKQSTPSDKELITKEINLEPINCDISVKIDKPNDDKNSNLDVSKEKILKPKESKIARPKSYPISTQSLENKSLDIPIDESKTVTLSSQTIQPLPEKSDFDPETGDVTVSFNISLPPKTMKVTKIDEQPIPANETKKTPTKKKIIVKKVKSSQKSASTNKVTKENSDKVANESLISNDTVSKNISKENDVKTTTIKKKSVFQSIGQKFEKLRNEGFSKGNSQEKELDTGKTIGIQENQSMSKNTRVVREHSVPIGIETEPITESGLIKRAVTITNLPTLDSPDSQGKKSVSRVLGLFKKTDSKDKAIKPQASNTEMLKEENESHSHLNVDANTDVKINQTLECKPKRPTSLLLNGIGKRVQACYGGATSDSALTKKDKKPSVENSTIEKVDEIKNTKKGLRLDFSKLPKLNQNIFNKRNSIDLPKDTDSKDSNSNQLEEVITAENLITENPLVIENVDVNQNNNDLKSDKSVCSNGNIASPTSDWSLDNEVNNYMKDNNKRENIHDSQVESDITPCESENIIDRIRRKSFYSRFNEKKNRRKSLLVGPGAKEYIPSVRINPQCDNEDFQYHNKYDLSPTSPTKYNPFTYENNHRNIHSLDKSDCLSPLSPKTRNNDPFHTSTYSNSEKLDRRYSDGSYLGGSDMIHHSMPRYQRTLSYFDEANNSTVEPKTASSRYGRTLSLLSPGIYATYSPRSHTRNSAILLRDSLDMDVASENILDRIRNRKKAAALQNSSENSTLDPKFRSNHTHNSENDTPTNNLE